MNFIGFLKTKTFRKHFLIAVLSICTVLFIIFQSLKFYTHHGEAVTVPDLRGLPLAQAIDILERQDFRFQLDSVYNVEKPAGTIFEQEPEPNALVKENRTIYLTMVSLVPPHVKVPDLTDVSYREAEAIITSYGLKIGELIYKPDLARNAVLGLEYKGQVLTPGRMIPKGSVIDVILGDGYGSQIVLPNLVGLSLDEAVFIVHGSNLAVGSILFDPDVTDSLAARVYKQYPPYFDSTSMIAPGSAIDLYLSDNPAKITTTPNSLRVE